MSLSPWDETQEDGVDTVAVNVVTIIDKVVNSDGVDTVAVNVVTIIDKVVNSDTELWWPLATLRTFGNCILCWYPGLCPAFNDVTKVCSIVRQEEQKFQIWCSFLSDTQECLSLEQINFYMVVWVQPQKANNSSFSLSVIQVWYCP